MTALGLWLGSIIPAREPAENARIAAFFQALDTPVTRSEARGSDSGSNRPVLAAATIVVGGLLIVAGVVAGSSQARWFDLSIGGALAGLGARLALAQNKTPKRQYSTTV
jgi:threonine/homoserine/homoserine lactone efflux protein